MRISSSTSPSSVLLGLNGAKIITDTNTYIGQFYALKAVGDCVIDEMLFSNSIEGSLNGVTVSAGDTIMLYGITGVTLASGSNAILYKI